MAIEVISVERHERRMSYDNRGRPSMTWREMYAKPRLYLSIDNADDGRKGENQMMHILFDRYDNRALTKFARDNGLITKALAQAGLDPTTKTVFSRKAGCSCGCSPASIIQTSSNSSFDLWVTIGDPVAIAEAAPYREASRYIQAIKAGRAMIKNAHLSGLRKVELKKLQTYWSDKDYHKWSAA